MDERHGAYEGYGLTGAAESFADPVDSPMPPAGPTDDAKMPAPAAQVSSSYLAGINPYAGPSRIEPTLQFVQSAIGAQPERTEEVLRAALRISPEQAENIIIAAIRANPEARPAILRIAKAASRSGISGALSILVALFLIELFSGLETANAADNDHADARRGPPSDSFIGWFTTAAVSLAILFDADAILKAKSFLRLADAGDEVSFDDLIDLIADLPEPETEKVVSLQAELNAQVAASRDGAEGAGRASFTDGVSSGPDGLAGQLNGRESLGRLGDEHIRNPSGDYGDPAEGNNPLSSPTPLSGLGDERRTARDDNDRPDEAIDPTRAEADEEEPDTVQVSGATAGEGDGQIVFAVTRSSGDGTARVSYRTVAGTAEEATDFTAASGDIVFAAGVTEMHVTVSLIDDDAYEGAENIFLVLTDSDALRVAHPVGLGVIGDNDVAPFDWTLSGDTLVGEGGAASYTIGLGGVDIPDGTEISVEIGIDIPGGLGAADATDFVDSFLADLQAAVDALGPLSGVRLDGNVLIFSSGAPDSFRFSLGLADDKAYEGAENFTVVIGNASHGNIEPSASVVTTAVTDNDSSGLTWSVSGSSVVDEGEAATYTIEYEDAGPADLANLRVDISLAFDTAAGNGDEADLAASLLDSIAQAISALGPNPGVRLEGHTLVFDPDGPRGLTFTLPIAADMLIEGAESYGIALTNPGTGTLGDATAVTTIVDGDADQLVWAIKGAETAAEGDVAEYCIVLSGATLDTGETASVELSALSGGSADPALQSLLLQRIDAAIADAGANGLIWLEGSRLVFSGGAPDTLFFTLPIDDDTDIELTEEISFALSSPSAGTIADTAAEVTTAILDNDGGAVVWSLVSGDTVAEGDAASFTLSRTGGILAEGVEIAVSLDMLDGYGGAGEDDLSISFEAALARAIADLGADSGVRLEGRTLIFGAGSPASLTFSLDTLRDYRAELHEILRVGISAVSLGVIAMGADVATATVIDSDSVDIRWSLAGDGIVQEGETAWYTLNRHGPALDGDKTVSIELRIALHDAEGAASPADFSEDFFDLIRAAIDALGPDSGIELIGNRLVFSAGAPESFTFGLPILDDLGIEGPENYTVSIGLPSDGALDGDGLVTTAILDNDGGNIIEGTRYADYLSGTPGRDILIGLNGGDILDAGAGDDDLYGGQGADVLIGGAGADRFVLSVADMDGEVDVIADFRQQQGDQIFVLDLLSDIDAPTVNIDDFLALAEDGQDTLVRIDLDGIGGYFGFETVAVISGRTGFELSEMLAEEHLVLAQSA